MKIFIYLLFIVSISFSSTNAQIENQDYKYKSKEEIEPILDSLHIVTKIDTNQVNSLLARSKALNFSKGIIQGHDILGKHFWVLDSVDRAKYHFQKKLAEAQHIKDKYEECVALGQLAAALNVSEDVEKATKISYLQLSLAEELGDSNQICDAYVVLFEIHNMGQDFDSEIKYINLALQYHTSENLSISKGYLYTMLASVYYSKSDFDNSLAQFELAKKAFKELAVHDESDKGYFDVYYGQLLIEIDSLELGIQHTEKAKKLFTNIGTSRMIAECLSSLIDAYQKLGDKEKVRKNIESLEEFAQEYSTPYSLYLLNRGKYVGHEFSKAKGLDTIVSNYINSIEDLVLDENHALIHETQKKLKVAEKENELLKTESELNRRSKERNLYLTLGIMTLISLVFLFFYFLSYKKLKQKSIEVLKLKERQQTIELINRLEENTSLSSQLESTQRGIAVKTTLIREFNVKLENIKSDLLKVSFSDKSLDKKIINKLKRGIDNDLKSEDSFIDFLDHFNAIYPKFFDEIQQRFPKLNTNDKKLCAYIKMNLESKEIANLLHINVSSVNTSRYRLRKKLKLSKSQDLNEFIHNF